MKKISSRDNPDYRRLLSLARSGQARREAGRILLDGAHLIDAYVKAFGAASLSLVVRASNCESDQVTAWVDGGRAFLVLADGLFNEVSPVDTPTGILAVAPLPASRSVARQPSFTVFVDGVQDPGNLGAILRSAAAAGAARAVLSTTCADPWSPKCLRGGMGAQFLIDVDDRADLVGAIRAFPGQVLAADATADQSLFESVFDDPVGFVVGAEGLGVSASVLAVCTSRVRIPMAEGVESLNAAAAATLLFYEWRRRKALRVQTLG
jgi:RNA methyltransferase, TrmH family